MLVRLGYVAMSVQLENCSPSKTVTVKNLMKIEDQEARISRLGKIAAENLQNCLRLLYYNIAHDIKVFRLTSRLFPLVTHPIAQDWDYTADLGELLSKIGQIARENQMRISSHPDHFTLINSPKPEVLEASLRDLDYHEKVFQAMGLEDAQMVMHIGGLYGSKEPSIQRFKENFHTHLPQTIKNRLLLENDDKSFNAQDVLAICQELHVPMVLDVHHHDCLNSGDPIGDLLPQVFATWHGKLPKVHFSSPRDEKNCRAHADEIDLTKFQTFLFTARELNQDFDVMIEAKNKDLALFTLMKQLVDVKGVKMIDQATIEV